MGSLEGSSGERNGGCDKTQVVVPTLHSPDKDLTRHESRGPYVRGTPVRQDEERNGPWSVHDPLTPGEVTEGDRGSVKGRRKRECVESVTGVGAGIGSSVGGNGVRKGGRHEG